MQILNLMKNLFINNKKISYSRETELNKIIGKKMM